MEVTISAPSRLHFCMIDLRGDLNRIYGSVGVAINQPKIILRASRSPFLKISGHRAERVKHIADLILRDSEISGSFKIDLISDIPEHSGFGSGTQLSLAVGVALSKLFNLNLTPEDVAIKLGRSMRSAVGLYAFKHGGFIIDAGHRRSGGVTIPPLIFRGDFPEDWFFVIGVPCLSQNMSGIAENEAFRKVMSPPSSLIGDISRIILMQMIPSVLERDIDVFGQALTIIDKKFGEFWFDIQGGHYSHPIIENGVNFLLESGASGAGQTSWGPAFFGLTQGREEAIELNIKLKNFLKKEGRNGQAFISQANNRGASININYQYSE